MIRIKRAYEPRAHGDGRRVLVERLWPRGMTKEALAADAWMRDVAPTTELRQWFGHRLGRWAEFKRRYEQELGANTDGWMSLLDAGKRGAVTLLYSSRDVEHNGAVVLRDFLTKRNRSGRTEVKRSSARPRHRR